MEKAFNIKDRINLFEIKKKQIVFNKEPKEFIISKKTMPAKVNKVFKENGNGNDKEKAINNPIRKTVSEEIEHFLFEKPAFPCLLISKDDNGKIEMNMNALNDIDIDKIKIRKEDSFEMIKRKNIKNIQIIDYSNFQFDISVIHNKANFQKEVKNTLTTSEKNSLIIGKYKLYSFNISEADLSFKSYFIDKFENIANDTSSDKTKAKEIDEIFENQGYFIPLKIYIGGLFLNKYDRTNIKGLRDSLINLNLDFMHDLFQIKGDLLNFSSNKNIENIFLNENTQIIGGDKREKKFEKWIETIKIFNSNIIECTNIIEAKNILPIELRKKLKIPLQLVECKYLARKKYFEYLNSLKEIKLDKEIGYNDISKGICIESDIPKIYKQKIKIFVEETLSNFGISRKEISESFNDIIVGFKIVSQRNDDYNGEWKIYFNPLLKKEINILFASQFVREQDYLLYIYLMKFPE